MILLTFSPEFPSRTVKVRRDISRDGARLSSLHVTIFPDLWGDYVDVVGGRHLLNWVTMGNELGDELVDQNPPFSLVLKESGGDRRPTSARRRPTSWSHVCLGKYKRDPRISARKYERQRPSHRAGVTSPPSCAKIDRIPAAEPNVGLMRSDRDCGQDPHPWRLWACGSRTSFNSLRYL